jgi:hypothetical protein
MPARRNDTCQSACAPYQHCSADPSLCFSRLHAPCMQCSATVHKQKARELFICKNPNSFPDCLLLTLRVRTFGFFLVCTPSGGVAEYQAVSSVVSLEEDSVAPSLRGIGLHWVIVPFPAPPPRGGGPAPASYKRKKQ